MACHYSTETLAVVMLFWTQQARYMTTKISVIAALYDSTGIDIYFLTKKERQGLGLAVSVWLS